METPKELAEHRAKELSELHRRLSRGDPLTEEDARTAAARAEESRLRAIKAHLAAAETHLSAARVHADTADVHDRAAQQDIGDIAAHRQAIDTHRAAAEHELRAALEAKRRAKADHRESKR